ncbi:MAG TPA: FAD-dependent oxidoreductase [Gemmataceae bacterium]|nr:FAD-dependent oxidoreductase [Gemmataceae bacterium]
MVVVGSGVIGTACAYFLARDGWQVTIIDQGDFGRGCSHGNCGFVCPSHVLPLAAPGVVRSALKGLRKRNSALTIKLRFDPALWGWLLRFVRRCNTADMLAAGQAIQALLNSSRDLYPQILKREAIDCEWQTRGMLFVIRSDAAMEHYAETDRLLRETFNLPSRRFDGKELTDLEPALKPGSAGGWLYESDGHLRPDRLMSGWRQALERQGVTIHTHCSLSGFAGSGDAARAALTAQGEFPADQFVVAAGAWTPLLGRHLGCRVPIQPGKGYSITMPRPALCPTYPLIFEEHRVAVTPMRSGYRLGSTMEFAGYDTSLRRERLELLRDAARVYLHEPYAEPVEEEWYGWRPMTPDGKPIIDRSPALDNVFLAAGHSMLGLSMAPATGKLIAELLGGGPPHIDPAPYRLHS